MRGWREKKRSKKGTHNKLHSIFELYRKLPGGGVVAVKQDKVIRGGEKRSFKTGQPGLASSSPKSPADLKEQRHFAMSEILWVSMSKVH